MRMSKQIDTLGSPPSNVRASTVAGVGSSVMKLTRKVSKQRCLSFSGCLFVILPGPFDQPRWPVGPPLMVVPSSGPSRSCLGKRRVAYMWERPISHTRCAVVVGHAQAMSRLTRHLFIEQSVSRRSRRVPSNSRQH